jgi:DNA-directed RNA polymerase specialized sigma24 family protein
MVEDDDEDIRLISGLADGRGEALEPLMEHWGDPVIETCFRALRDVERTFDLYGEVWASVYERIRIRGQIPDSFESWLVDVIDAVVRAAAGAARIPIEARLRMRMPQVKITAADLALLEALRDPATQREAREALPREFSAAADRMLGRLPGPSTLSHIKLSTHGGGE